MKKVLIFYSELAGYTVACLNYFKVVHPNVEIHLVSWPVNPEAPFQFKVSEAIKRYNRRDFDSAGLIRLVNEVSPDLILCSGWMDKEYLKAVKSRKDTARAVLLMDNRWSGSLKQRIATFVAPFMITKSFDYAWVPGNDQKYYARKLGFASSAITTGFYSGDTDLFSISQPRKQVAHRFVYAGRYYDFKGVKEMWNEFVKFSNSSSTDWELWCFGIGDVEPIQHERIRHFGFKQPDQLADAVKDGGVFILPSKFEPWGVVVHEFAVAGFPLLLSNEVGAAAQFLAEGKNGFKFNIHEPGNLAATFKKMAGLTDQELLQMSNDSRNLGATISPQTWSETLIDLINRN
jgi:hypothetical protein